MGSRVQKLKRERAKRRAARIKLIVLILSSYILLAIISTLIFIRIPI